MEILLQELRVIDYENNEIYLRETPAAFSEYVKQLISYVNDNTSIREYQTRSRNTEVINSIIEIINNKSNQEVIKYNIDIIAKRLLLKEREAQEAVSHMNVSVQKGSLIQALLYNEEENTYMYMLAKVEHTDFVDDNDFSFKTGFSKDKKKIWKSCIFEIDDINNTEFKANVYSNTVARYWYDNFLELNQMTNDETNTIRAFNAIDKTLNKTIKNSAPRDYTMIRNSVISYFKTNDYIDFNSMIQTSIEQYDSDEIDTEKKEDLINKLKELPDKFKFDKQFNSVPSVISAKTKRTFDLCTGIQLNILGAVENLDSTVQSYRDKDGKHYIRIRVDDNIAFKTFLK